mgnify:CR=1 FL=1
MQKTIWITGASSGIGREFAPAGTPLWAVGSS